MKRHFAKILLILFVFLISGCTINDFENIALDNNYGQDEEIKKDIRDKYLKDFEQDR